MKLEDSLDLEDFEISPKNSPKVCETKYILNLLQSDIGTEMNIPSCFIVNGTKLKTLITDGTGNIFITSWVVFKNH